MRRDHEELVVTAVGWPEFVEPELSELEEPDFPEVDDADWLVLDEPDEVLVRVERERTLGVVATAAAFAAAAFSRAGS